MFNVPLFEVTKIGVAGKRGRALCEVFQQTVSWVSRGDYSVWFFSAHSVQWDQAF